MREKEFVTEDGNLMLNEIYLTNGFGFAVYLKFIFA